VSYIDAYRGQFDKGWDAWRAEVYERQLASGLLPAGTELSERPSWVPPWDSLSVDERRVAARMMEVFAGFLTHTDAQVARVLAHIEALGETDNTVVVVMSDNGASAEGGKRGSFNEQYFFNFVPESLPENLARIDLLGRPGSNNHYPWGWAWAGNTPLKRFKRDTHEGGVADPLIVSWPARIGSPGETRHQYVHAIDLVPTLLEVIGVEPPASIAGVPQSPIEGVSFASSLTDGSAASAHVTQYYEMLGSRALYHDGWKAVVFHTSPFIAYDGGDMTKPFDDDVWELYHVAEDFSEVHDLAASEPEKLAEMVELWWSEAQRFQVLPLNNQPGRFGDHRYRRDRYEFLGPTGPIAESVAPNLRNRGWAIAAELREAGGAAGGAAGGRDGVIVAHGGHSGGYVLYVRDDRLCFTYNWLATEISTVTAEVALPPGDVVVHAAAVRRPEGGIEVELRYGDVPVGTVVAPHTTPVTYGTPGFAVGHQPAGPIHPELRGRQEMSPSVLGRVVVEAYGRDALRDAVEGMPPTDRVDLATQ